jgi:hypothetical protein
MTPARIGATVRFSILGIALNVAGPIVRIGFILFAVLAAAWVVVGWRIGELSPVTAQRLFLATSPPGRRMRNVKGC